MVSCQRMVDFLSYSHNQGCCRAFLVTCSNWSYWRVILLLFRFCTLFHCFISVLTCGCSRILLSNNLKKMLLSHHPWYNEIFRFLLIHMATSESKPSVVSLTIICCVSTSTMLSLLSFEVHCSHFQSHQHIDPTPQAEGNVDRGWNSPAKATRTNARERMTTPLQQLDDGWPESVEQQGLLLLVLRYYITRQYIKDVLKADKTGSIKTIYYKYKTLVCIVSFVLFFRIQNLLHTDAFAQKLLHTGAFTYRDFYSQTLLRTDAFTHRSFCTQKLLHTEGFTHRHWSLCTGFNTQTPLHTDTFTRRHFYTQTLLHTEAFTHRRIYTQKRLHTDVFTHRSVCTQTSFTQTLSHTEVFTHRCFYTQTPLHTGTFYDTEGTLFWTSERNKKQTRKKGPQ